MYVSEENKEVDEEEWSVLTVSYYERHYMGNRYKIILESAQHIINHLTNSYN